MKKLINLFLTFLIISCAQSQSKESVAQIPSWYLNPAQNNSSYIYGISQGATPEEATRLALADMASRLIVTISATSTLVREENQNSVNEEMRQKVNQNIEKIEFANFEVSNSAKVDNLYYREVSVDRNSFTKVQKEKLILAEKKLDDLSKNSQNKNPIQKRSDLIKSLTLAKELELYARILDGLGININLREKLNRIAQIENEMSKNLDKIEFFFASSTPSEIKNIIASGLNKEKIAVSQVRKANNQNQILINISSKKEVHEIYGSFVCKLSLAFSNSIEEKILASANLEISGSSVIDKEQSCLAALKNLEEKINANSVLKIIGILN
jgi:hypothetical protein